MWEVYCNCDQVLFDYLLNLLAWTVQNPTKKPGVALILIGKQGCGKSDVFQALGECLFGKRYVTVLNDINNITRHFNAELEGKKVVIGDEVKGLGKDSEKLKNLITCNTLRLEKKGVDAYFVDDTAFYVFISNTVDYYKMEQGDRRYLVLNCSDKYCGDKEYFDALFQELEKRECGDHLYTYLAAERDVSKFNRVKDLPVTSTKITMMEVSENPAISFIKSISIGELYDYAHKIVRQVDNITSYTTSILENNKFSGYIQATHWYEIYKDWHRDHYNGVAKESRMKFCIQIAKHCEQGRTSRNAITYKPIHWNSIKDFQIELLSHFMSKREEDDDDDDATSVSEKISEEVIDNTAFSATVAKQLFQLKRKQKE
jgi:hypothetical protein